ncbi:MAG: glycerol-3-phosphate 1-O-acyltransferase PlsY [Chloroflexota bacterium]
MTWPLGAVAAVLVGYLVGAIPVGLLIGRLTRGIDLREHGSRRTGTTNALRTLGPRAAALVFVLDIAKGVVAVLAARAILAAGPPGSLHWVAAAAGTAAVAGHIWSVFIRMTGGRGVATSAGALGAMSPLGLGILVPVVGLVVWRSRYVSLGSVIGAVTAPIITTVLAIFGLAPWAATGYAVAAGGLVVWAHADNIQRLRSGTERRLGQRTEADAHG